MSILRRLDSVPAYLVSDDKGATIPVIVSLLLRDGTGAIRLTPAVESAINKTIDITGCFGLLTRVVSEGDTVKDVEQVMAKAISTSGAILLFQCQNPATAEALMVCVSRKYAISLVQR